MQKTLKNLEIAIKALKDIHNNSGKVCPDFALCKHLSCQSSYYAWATADIALRELGLYPEEEER